MRTPVCAAIAVACFLSLSAVQAQPLIWEVTPTGQLKTLPARYKNRSAKLAPRGKVVPSPSATTRNSRRTGSARSSYSNAAYFSGGGNYLHQTDGETRWPHGQVIRVYVAPGRPDFPNMVASCFNEWKRASGGRIRFSFVSSPSEADYTISWSGRQKEVYAGTEAGLTTTDTVFEDDGREYIERAHTRILTRLNGRALSEKAIAETCLHEIGHGLGINGHSSNPADIMYYANSRSQTGHLTNRDANTIAQLYAN